MVPDTVDDRILSAVDERRLVDLALELVSISSPTGAEEPMAVAVRDRLNAAGLQVQWQQVEEGRANVVGVRPGAGGGPSLMFNGHMDTSYSGDEPWLQGIPGFQPEAFARDGRIYGLGISNMKGALCCYVEALQALQDAGIGLRGDVMIAAVCGEIEKAQWGEDFRGQEYRGYAAGTRHLVTHGGLADMCILGEPTEQKVMLGHYGALWLRLSTTGPFLHTAFFEGRMAENSIVRMHDVVQAVREWIPQWEERTAYGGAPGIVGIGAINGGFPWRASRTPHRTDLFVDVRVPPTMPMPRARSEVLDFVRGLQRRWPDYGIECEFYVSSPGSEIDEGHALIAAIDDAHQVVFGRPPERDTGRWFSDASALARYGIPSVNYGTSSGKPDPELGENLEIEGLVRMAKSYALAATRVCGVAE